MMPTTRDVRVEVPAASDQYIDFVTPEATFLPGEEKMWCALFTYTGPTTAWDKVVSLQGKFGHHLVLLGASADETRPDGTMYDCTKMTNFQPYAIPLDAFPPNYGTELLSGKRLIIQFHYLNTGTVPLLARDVIRLQKKDPATVTKWMSVYATNQVAFTIPVGAQNLKTTYDCALPYDVDLLAFGGHMHEHGVSFRSELGDGTTMTQLYTAGDWMPDYRDSPPIDLYVQNPKPLHTGQVLRTTCAWNNTTDHELKFPEEMCATFGLVAGTKQPVVCTVTQ
jgi:hypothetical protein